MQAPIGAFKDVKVEAGVEDDPRLGALDELGRWPTLEDDDRAGSEVARLDRLARPGPPQLEPHVDALQVGLLDDHLARARRRVPADARRLVLGPQARLDAEVVGQKAGLGVDEAVETRRAGRWAGEGVHGGEAVRLLPAARRQTADARSSGSHLGAILGAVRER